MGEYFREEQQYFTVKSNVVSFFTAWKSLNGCNVLKLLKPFASLLGSVVPETSLLCVTLQSFTYLYRSLPLGLLGFLMS